MSATIGQRGPVGRRPTAAWASKRRVPPGNRARTPTEEHNIDGPGPRCKIRNNSLILEKDPSQLGNRPEGGSE